jgi:ADP-ribose pyrophosphatase YjhB (NUDIX family)
MIRVEQAGGIAFRQKGGVVRVLLVKAKKDPSLWIFPKGHIEKGETAEDAALRETLEEAGVSGELLAPAGVLEFQSGREPVRVRYFVIRATCEADSPEGREKGWFTLAEARERLQFENARELLKGVESLLVHGR